MAVPRTLTEALNAQPAVVIPSGAHATTSTVREVPYAERYRASTAIRETPAERLQRIAGEDAGLERPAS